MIINWKLWNKPETGGVLIFLFLSTLSFLFMLFTSAMHYQDTQEELKQTILKITTLNEQIDKVESCSKIIRQFPQKFKAFKRKKWTSLLTEKQMNDYLYTIQKQSKVIFLLIHQKNNSVANDIRKTEISLNVKTLQDKHFFDFLKKLESELPGIISIKKFELKRSRELNSQTAKKINAGEKVYLFEGNIDFEIEHPQFSGSQSIQ